MGREAHSIRAKVLCVASLERRLSGGSRIWGVVGRDGGAHMTTEAGHSLMMLSALTAAGEAARVDEKNPTTDARYCVAEEMAREKARLLTHEEVAKLASLRELARAAASHHGAQYFFGGGGGGVGMPPPAASERLASKPERAPSFHASPPPPPPPSSSKRSASSSEATKSGATSGQRFLRPSELFANDFRARVRAEHPGFLDRAVRSKLSEMWRDVDPATRAEYVEKARLEREKARAKQAAQPKRAETPPLASKSSLTTQQLARGDAVSLVDDSSKKGVVTGTTASWVLVNFFGECQTPKERPWRLSRAAPTKGSKAPFDLVSSAQASLDSRVPGNRFRDADGCARRVLVAVLRGRGDDVGVVCDACSLSASFSGTFRLADVGAHLQNPAHLAAVAKSPSKEPRRRSRRCGRCGPCRAKKGAPCQQAAQQAPFPSEDSDDESSTLGWVASVPAGPVVDYRVEASEFFLSVAACQEADERRSELAQRDKDRALGMLQQNTSMRAVAAALGRPVGDVLAWYYKECDDDDGERETWLPTRRSKRRHNSDDDNDDSGEDAPATHPVVVADFWATFDATNPETPGLWATEESRADAVETSASSALTPPKQRVTGRVAGPAGTASLSLSEEFAFDGRLWLLRAPDHEAIAAERGLDPVQLAHAQTLVDPAISRLVLLPSIPTRPPPSPPSEKDAARLGCLGGELLQVSSATYGSRLWYCVRPSETLADVGRALTSVEIPAKPSQQLTASELSGFGADARSAPQAQLLASHRVEHAADRLWLEQLQFCDATDVWASRIARDHALRPLLPRRLWRLGGIVLVPEARGFPAPSRRSRSSRRDASSSDDDDASFSARRSRVLCVLPPPRQTFADEPTRKWARRIDALAVCRRLAATEPADEAVALAAALDCDPVGLARRNPGSPSHLLLPAHDLVAPCTSCRVLGDRRKFGCRVARAHHAPPFHEKSHSLVRVRRRQDDQTCWFFATLDGDLRYEFPRCCRPMRSRLSEPLDADADLAYVHNPPDFEAVARRCETLVDRTFRFRKSRDRVFLVTDAYYSLAEGVDALVCEYVALETAATAHPDTCTLAHLQATADWLKKPRKLSAASDDAAASSSSDPSRPPPAPAPVHDDDDDATRRDDDDTPLPSNVAAPS